MTLSRLEKVQEAALEASKSAEVASGSGVFLKKQDRRTKKIGVHVDAMKAHRDAADLHARAAEIAEEEGLEGIAREHRRIALVHRVGFDFHFKEAQKQVAK